MPKAIAEEILPESVISQATPDGEGICITDAVSNAIAADALIEQEIVTDLTALSRLDAFRQLEEPNLVTGFKPPASDMELDGLDLER